MDQMVSPKERIFGLSGVGSNGRMTDEEMLDYESLVQAKIQDAVDFEESYLAGYREDNQAYFYGLKPVLYNPDDTVDENERPNKSNFVSRDVHDTIMAIIPSLIRIFTTSDEKIMEFVPHSEDEQEIADLMYDYANHIFYNENDGFTMLYGLIKDALTVKAAITTWWTDTDFEIMEQTFQNIDVEQYQALIEEAPDIEVTELDMAEGSQFIDSLTLRYAVSKPQQKVVAVPPDEFRIARDAKTVKTADLVGWERNEKISSLVKKGYDAEYLRDFVSSAPVLSDERYMRNPGLVDDNAFGDTVMYGEWYIRIDGDGDGVDELRRICTIGNGRQVISDEPVGDVNMAIWSTDPRPHTAIGDCPADDTKDIQNVKSQLIRGQLDSLADSINPRMVINELTTNIEDALNEDIGAVIRVRGAPRDQVDFIKQPYAGDQIQPAIDYLDQVRAARTGITEASKGLDPAAMQSTTLTGINAIVSGAQERIELIARLLAETGLKPTFMGIVREAINNPNAERQIKLRGKFVKVNPSLFDPSYRLEVNPTLGKGSDMTRLQALMDVRQTQIMIMEKFGPSNPVVSPVEFHNTLADLLSIVNIKNVTRYFKAITPEIMEGINSTPKEPDAATLLAQAELEKVKKDIVVATDKSRQADDKLVLETEKARLEDDFRRDKLNVDAMLRVLDITMDPEPQTITPGEPRPSAAVESANRPG